MYKRVTIGYGRNSNWMKKWCFLSQWRSIVDAKPITGAFRHSNENRSNVNLFLKIPLLGDPSLVYNASSKLRNNL